MTVKILVGDCRDILKTLPDESVQCVVTSPPYYGLRDYGTAEWEGGDAECDHVGTVMRTGPAGSDKQASNPGSVSVRSGNCAKCGAVRVDSQIGLEQTPDDYVAEMVAVFREVRRVLRDDGAVWLNLGSSYASGIIESQDYIMRDDITDDEYLYAVKEITKALSEVWEANAPTEQDVQGVLGKKGPQAGELHGKRVPGMRTDVYEAQGTEREVLRQVLRQIGESDKEEESGDSNLSHVRGDIREAQFGDKEEREGSPLLQSRMLVRTQPAEESLPMDGRPIGKDESRGESLAQGGYREGQGVLQDLPFVHESGGASYISVRDVPGKEMGNKQWPNALPELSPQIPPSGNGLRRSVVNDSVNPRHRIRLTFRKSDLPESVLAYFRPVDTIKPKDEIDIPNMVCEALRRDGWYRRQTIVWAKAVSGMIRKGSAMPESVRDRFCKSHEYVFLLTKSARYFFDSVAVADILDDGSRNPAIEGRGTYGGERGSVLPDVQRPQKQQTTATRRDVWLINPQGFSGAHFATFPPALIEPMILAGTGEHGACSVCGAPWERVTDRSVLPPPDRINNNPFKHDAMTTHGEGAHTLRNIVKNETTGWQPTCDHAAAPVVPCVTLDIFGGAGTTALVADRLGRDAIIIELNPEYAEMARRRIINDAGMFAQVEVIE